MTREWKPGTVAMVTGPEGTRRAVRRGGVWINLDREGYVIDAYAETVRPLVVLDPEARDAVERLVGILREHGGQGSASVVDRYVLALREFANPTPPRPDEPQGLGAVVEDETGHRWTRFSSEGIYPWLRNGGGNKNWSEIAAVRVLSPGVTP
jgi:hypothetical protein